MSIGSDAGPAKVAGQMNLRMAVVWMVFWPWAGDQGMCKTIYVVLEACSEKRLCSSTANFTYLISVGKI